MSLLYHEHVEALSFPQIYFGHPREITTPHATQFPKATSETRCSDLRGLEPAQIFYMTIKVIRLNIDGQTVTCCRNACR
ncbi:hypothetical protein MTO96_046925 [Rhipicephalus appendiculatus]